MLRRFSPRRSARLVAALTRAAVMTFALPMILLAASPAPSQPGAGDPRSSGQGPGLVGDPLMAIVIVGAIGLASVVATLAYVRLTRGRRGHDATG